MAFSESALKDADILLYVTDVIESPEKNMDFLEKVQKMQIPVLLLINKIDELQNSPNSQKTQNVQEVLGDIVTKWHSLLPQAEILPISAKNKFGIDILLKRIREMLPEVPVEIVDEYRTTDDARRVYWKAHPPTGWRRFLPTGMQVPPVPVDDFVAVLLAQRYLTHRNS